MIRNILRLSTVILMTLIVGHISSCQKRVFKYIEVHGRLVNYMTNEPIVGEVELYADQVKTIGKTHDSERVLLGRVQTKPDGKFSIKSRASKGSNYYLHVDGAKYQPKAWPAGWNSLIDVSPGQKNDLGDIPAGRYTFTIKIKLNPVTANSLWVFPCTGDKNYVFYPQFSNGTIINECSQTYVEYMIYKHYRLRWKAEIYNPSHHYHLANNHADIPLNGTDTLTYTLSY